MARATRRQPTPWGDRIKQRRTELGLTQDDLAEAVFQRRGPEAQFTSTSVANLETGVVRDPHISTVKDIAAVLGVPIDWIVWGDEQPIKEPTTVDEMRRRITDQIDAMLALARQPSEKDELLALADAAERQADAAKRSRKSVGSRDTPRTTAQAHPR